MGTILVIFNFKKMNLDYEKITPMDIMQFLKLKGDTKRIKQILDLGIFKAEEGELIILSNKCTITKQYGQDEKKFKKYFPFFHQVFWFELMETKDLDFAISEVKRIKQCGEQYLFPNGTRVELGK